MKTKSKEEYLLQRIAQGNHDAFWQLWLRYQDYLYHRCQMWMGGNQIDAEEALSQARLKAWEKLPQYASKITNAQAWLTRMTHNLCVDIHRQRQRRAKNTDTIDDMAIKTSNTGAYYSDVPELAILHHELKIYIHRAIKSLPPKLRDVWSLIYYYQISSAEIAQRLMISKNNVYKRIQQGRIILQKQLRKYISGINNDSNEHKKMELKNKLSTMVIQKEKQSFGQFETSHKSKSQKDSLAYSPKIDSQFSIPVLTQVINYQVTALCLEQFSLAQ